MDGANLQFNLGLVLYKLGRYAHSRAQFQAVLAAGGDYVSAAQHHLGLIAIREGTRHEGIALLRQSESSATSERQRALARTTLARLGEGPRAPRAVASAYASAGAGHDSNPVLLADDTDAGKGEDGDAYAELLAVAQLPLVRRRQADLLGEFSVYAREYEQVSDLRQQSAQAGLRYQHAGPRWQTSLIGQGEASFVGGDTFQTAAVAGIEWRRWSMGATRIAFDAGAVRGGNGYGYLDGWRYRGSVEQAFALRSSRLRLGYDVEVNDRDDLAIDDDFYSRSPLRQRISARWSGLVGERWSLEIGGRYRYARYADPDVTNSGGVADEKRRTEHLAEATLGLRYRLNSDWSLLAQYQFQNNDSNLDEYGYERHGALLAFEWSQLSS